VRRLNAIWDSYIRNGSGGRSRVKRSVKDHQKEVTSAEPRGSTKVRAVYRQTLEAIFAKKLANMGPDCQLRENTRVSGAVNQTVVRGPNCVQSCTALRGRSTLDGHNKKKKPLPKGRWRIDSAMGGNDLP